MGRSWAALGHLLAVFWTFEDELFSSMGTRWALRDLLDRFGVDSGRDLEEFGGDLGRFGKNFGRILGLLSEEWADLGNARYHLALLGRILS